MKKLDKKGFTIIEMAIVVVVIGALVGVGLYAKNRINDNSSKAQTANSSTSNRYQSTVWGLDFSKDAQMRNRGKFVQDTLPGSTVSRQVWETSAISSVTTNNTNYNYISEPIRLPQVPNLWSSVCFKPMTGKQTQVLIEFKDNAGRTINRNDNTSRYGYNNNPKFIDLATLYTGNTPAPTTYVCWPQRMKITTSGGVQQARAYLKVLKGKIRVMNTNAYQPVPTSTSQTESMVESSKSVDATNVAR